jgi:hypothetical protein
MRIRDGKIFDPGWKNSDPGSEINIPDPQESKREKNVHYISMPWLQII